MLHPLLHHKIGEVQCALNTLKPSTTIISQGGMVLLTTQHLSREVTQLSSHRNHTDCFRTPRLVSSDTSNHHHLWHTERMTWGIDVQCTCPSTGSHRPFRFPFLLAFSNQSQMTWITTLSRLSGNNARGENLRKTSRTSKWNASFEIYQRCRFHP